MVFTWFGSGSSIENGSVLDLSRGAQGIPPTHATQIRDDLTVPVMVVNSECETLSCHPLHRADSELYRHWEVAGAPHGPRRHMERILGKLGRDGVVDLSMFDVDAMVPVPWAPVFDAALVHVDRWMRGGSPPPSQKPIALEGTPVRIRRDGDGNAEGGVRVAEMAAPTGRAVGAIEEAGAAGLLGQWFPFDAGTLRARYGDRQGYLDAYRTGVDEAVRAGVLCRQDADDAMRRAEGIDLA